jgi:hypothetical protein
VMEGKTREWAKKVRTVNVRVDCNSAEHGSVAVVRRSASGCQDRSSAEGRDRHDRDDRDCSELHVASEGGRCE